MMIENSRKLKFMSIMTQEISDEWIPVWIDRLDKMGFFTAPASIHHHSAYEGGLFDHSYQVTLNLLNLTRWLHLIGSALKAPILWVCSMTCASVTTISARSLMGYTLKHGSILMGSF